MKLYTVYYIVDGENYSDCIYAYTARAAKYYFFQKHSNIPYKIDAIWDDTTNIQVYKGV